MKKIIGILLTSTVLSASAFANAGPAAPAPCPACPEATPAKWGGFKLGAQLGYAHGHNSIRAAGLDGGNAFTFVNTYGSKGAVGGMHFGYDYQMGKNWLVGLETSFDAAGIKFRNPTSSMKTKWNIAVMPRVGYVLNDSLFYVGAGWATSKFEVRSVAFDNNNAKKSRNLSAFRMSVGAAQRMNKVLLGVEAAYSMHKAFKETTIDAAAGDNFRTTIKPRVLEAKIKLSYMM